MRKTGLFFLFLSFIAMGFAQTPAKLLSRSTGIKHLAFQPVATDSLYQPAFLEIAAKKFKIELDSLPGFRVQHSILRYDLKPLPTEPTFIFSDRNNFEARYRASNPAYFEALKNTTYSQLYNPFALHKSL